MRPDCKTDKDIRHVDTGVLISILSNSGCGRPQSMEALLGEELTLAIGERASIAEEKLEVKFSEVIEDSRCPGGVTCFWAGRVPELTQTIGPIVSSATCL